jgi:peptidyl-prolyl cis-trans isomerase SurA
MKTLIKYFLLIVWIAPPAFVLNIYGQERVVIDQVVAVIGNNAILKSDIIEQRRMVEAQGMDFEGDPECILLNDIMFQKLLYNQALIDSVEVSELQVEQEIERRMRYFIQQIGSRERLEEYYGKSIDELREEFRDPIREQQISRRMEEEITKNVNVTPSEVRVFFENLPEEDIPMVESEMALSKILMEPPIPEEEINALKERLEGFRQRILDGESFNTLAILYSDDAGSARRGGELGFYGRGDLHPEFEAVAFSLSPGELSEIVETKSGFHIIQLIERRGELVNVRHLLLQPKASPETEEKTRNKLDSIRTVIMRGDMTFSEAARQFSDHPGGRSGGAMLNPFTGTTRFSNEDLEPNLFFVVDRLEVGEISRPIQTMTDDGKQAFEIVTVRDRIEPHRANLQQDYDFIQRLAMQEKNQEAINRWVERRLQSTYVHIHEKYSYCDFEINWLQ